MLWPNIPEFLHRSHPRDITPVFLNDIGFPIPICPYKGGESSGCGDPPYRHMFTFRYIAADLVINNEGDDLVNPLCPTVWALMGFYYGLVTLPDFVSYEGLS